MAIFSGRDAQPQDSWKVMLSGKTILQSNAEDREKNLVKIAAADLKRKKFLQLRFTSQSQQKGWERTIAAYDEKDKELVKQKGNSFTLANELLLSFFKNAKRISIYTMSVPTDPRLKASVRVRRIHLCTLELTGT